MLYQKFFYLFLQIIILSILIIYSSFLISVITFSSENFLLNLVTILFLAYIFYGFYIWFYQFKNSYHSSLKIASDKLEKWILQNKDSIYYQFSNFNLEAIYIRKKITQIPDEVFNHEYIRKIKIPYVKLPRKISINCPRLIKLILYDTEIEELYIDCPNLIYLDIEKNNIQKIIIKNGDPNFLIIKAAKNIEFHNQDETFELFKKNNLNPKIIQKSHLQKKLF